MSEFELVHSRTSPIAKSEADAAARGLVAFVPRREVSAKENVEAFVAHARNRLTVFGASLPFDSNRWDLSSFIPIVGKADKELRAVFNTWNPKAGTNRIRAETETPDETVAGNDDLPGLADSPNSAVYPKDDTAAAGAGEGALLEQAEPLADEEVPMPEPFCGFAKAYVRYQHGLRPTKVIGFRLAALRSFCAALHERGTHAPWDADSHVFNRASQLVKGRYSASAAYRVGQQLEMLAKSMDVNRLTGTPLSWRNAIKRPSSYVDRVGEEFQERRESLLPSDFELDSLARAYRASTAPVEITVTSAAALLCCAPDRIGEVTRLPEDCIVTQVDKSGGEQVGLRWWPEKGADPMIKWVATPANDLAKEAVGRLAGASAVARGVARWYEENPTSLYLPPHLEHMRKQAMWSLEDVGKGICVEPMPVKSARQWCNLNNVELVSPKRGQTFAKFVDVQRAIVALLPKRFPILDVETGLRFKNALCIARRNEFHDVRPTFWGVIEAVDQALISTGLGNRSEHGLRSVFERLNLFHADGSSIAIGTKQFRHYLNTLAQKGGLSELDIAKWSGRLDVGQNGAYNSVSDRDLQAKLLAIRGAGESESGTAVTVSKVKIVPRSTLEKLGVKAAHVTDHGYCEHDFASSPCQLFGDCDSCNEQTCIKGSTDAESVRRHVADTGYLLAQAEAGEREGEYGASQWVQHQRQRLARLTSLLSILEDPLVPDGAVIRLNYVKPPSRLAQAQEARRELGVDTGPEALTWAVDVEGGGQ